MNHNGNNHLVSWSKDSNWLPSSNESYRLPPGERKIVVIGGGSGASVVLQGLKQYTSRLTAIVTMFDSGGSSGLLRQELGYPPFGDLRQCLLALSKETEHAEALRSLVGFRFPKDCSLHGHSLGNLLLAGLTSLYDVEEAIEKLSRLLRVRGQVVPVTLEQANLCAELEDGSILRGETAIDLRRSPSPRISRVFVEPRVPANPRAIWAILQADAVVLGPGDLYTSIIPNLLVKGIPEALSRTTATIIYVCNLMTKPGETDDFRASDFVGEINHYLNRASVDWAVVNTGTIPTEIQETYAREGARPVESDMERLKEQGTRSFGGALAGRSIPLHHDPTSLAEVIASLMALRQAHERQPTIVGNGAERHDLLMPLGQR